MAKKVKADYKGRLVVAGRLALKARLEVRVIRVNVVRQDYRGQKAIPEKGVKWGRQGVKETLAIFFLPT
jgi:hypothetical protein